VGGGVVGPAVEDSSFEFVGVFEEGVGVTTPGLQLLSIKIMRMKRNLEDDLDIQSINHGDTESQSF
jgi:hypothetical protein